MQNAFLMFRFSEKYTSGVQMQRKPCDVAEPVTPLGYYNMSHLVSVT